MPFCDSFPQNKIGKKQNKNRVGTEQHRNHRRLYPLHGQLIKGHADNNPHQSKQSKIAQALFIQ